MTCFYFPLRYDFISKFKVWLNAANIGFLWHLTTTKEKRERKKKKHGENCCDSMSVVMRMQLLNKHTKKEEEKQTHLNIYLLLGMSIIEETHAVHWPYYTTYISNNKPVLGNNGIL